jgi:hypothetical protein
LKHATNHIQQRYKQLKTKIALMKKILLLIGLFLFNLNTYCQDEKIEYGIILGFQNSSFIENNESPVIYQGKIGYHAGIYISFILNEKISIRPELLYLARAGSILKMEGGGSSGFNFFNIRGNHIYGEITESLVFLPILAEYKLNHRFSLGIGPVFGYSINRKVEYDNNSFNEFMDNNNTSEKFELNLGIDFGYSLNNIGLFIRYNHGIKERQNLKTSLFQLGLNYKL